MSHAATNWAIKQRGLKPTTRIVLWHLSDCHNPAQGCFPSQKYLADACEVDERTVRRHLNYLEESGLISRQKRLNSSGEYMSDRYILRCENAPADNLSNGQSSAAPADKRVPHQRTNCPPIDVREPLSKPVTARAYSFSEFWKVWPNKDAEAAAKEAWKKLKPADRQVAIGTAASWFAAWRAKCNPDTSPILPASYLNGRRWTDKGTNPQKASDDAALTYWADLVNSEKPLFGVSPAIISQLMQSDLVSQNRMCERGLI